MNPQAGSSFASTSKKKSTLFKALYSSQSKSVSQNSMYEVCFVVVGQAAISLGSLRETLQRIIWLQ